MEGCRKGETRKKSKYISRFLRGVGKLSRRQNEAEIRFRRNDASVSGRKRIWLSERCASNVIVVGVVYVYRVTSLLEPRDNSR